MEMMYVFRYLFSSHVGRDSILIVPEWVSKMTKNKKLVRAVVQSRFEITR